jgi:DNA-directed RNA polymerase I, II, and III subunit RPABC1
MSFKIDPNMQKAIIVISEMLRDRGNIEWADNLKDHVYEPKDGNVNTIHVSNEFKIIFVNTGKFVDIQKELEKTHKVGGKYCLIVFKDKFTAGTVKNIKKKAQDELKMKYQVFRLQELQSNISKHVLVPKHVIMSPEEEKSIMKTHNIKTKSQLPTILKTDPMARYLFAKSGDLIKVTRDTDVFIRHVI